MKRFCFYCLIMLLLQSCEDVVDVDLNTETPRLVVEATGIQKAENSTGLLQIKLSKTAPYFQDSIPKVSHAEISLKINDNVIDIPESSEYPGVYQHIIPMMNNENYQLTIKVEGETYQSNTQLYKTTPIDTIEQEEGIFDSDQILLKIFYTDPVEDENYYLFSFLSKHEKKFGLSDDEFYNGNQTSTLYMEEFDPGDSIHIQIDGTSKGFNRYFSTLLGQGSSGNPFATAPATVRGNIINRYNQDNFALGYFRISQQYETTYIVE